MCDTLGFTVDGKSVFGKNSDRSPNEPQILQYIDAKKNEESNVKLTYITIPQVRDTHAVLLSRPTWLWGAEMGVNDCGVCIGNEAVWTLGKYGKDSLIGMDLLRLALERSDTAENALKVITSLLEEYGQGGNCGYDHQFFYDNSFLVMDKNELFVLETAGKEWVYKKYDRASISNRLSIGNDGDVYSGKPCNFALKHTEHLYNIASGSAPRKKQTGCCLDSADSVEDVMKALRKHNDNCANPFAKGTVSSTCMHFGGIVGDHTTASMVCDIKGDKTVVWATGSSLPCVSLFKPWVFGEKETPSMKEGAKYWYTHEAFRRSLIGKIVPDDFYSERDEIEKKWLKLAEENADGLTDICFADEKSFYDRWSSYKFDDAEAGSAFKKRWSNKTDIFFKEMDNT